MTRSLTHGRRGEVHVILISIWNMASSHFEHHVVLNKHANLAASYLDGVMTFSLKI